MIQAVTFANSVLSKVADLITREKSVKGAVKSGLNDIKLEMKMVISEIKLNEENNQGATHESKVVLLKELAYDIEDFIDRTWVPGASGPLLSVFGLDPRPEIVQKIEHFKGSIQKVRTWQPDAGSSNGEDSAATRSSCPSATPPNPYSQDLDHEDTFRSICRHRCELGMLLSAAEGQELKVISIVGCRGVGKTSLARAVYDDCRDEYDCVAWVIASEYPNLEELLAKLLKEAQRTAKPTPTAAQGSISDTEQTSLRNFLSDKRYFVVIDDVDRLEVCQAIKREFPKDGHSSRIIVTTSMHSVAAECSSGSHVYTMQCLDKDESEEVFWESVGQENQTPALRRASEGIIKKCGGLPLALISVANYLRRRGQTENHVAGGLTTEHCKSTACTLGDKILKGQDEFLEINRALLQCYNNLPDHDHQSCLLYASVFPRGRPINSKVLLRRWMSEEFAAHGTVSNEESVKSCLEAFIERCIVEPVEIKNARVARCKVHSIMLEFIIHKAVSKKFVALVDKDELLSNNGTITNVRVRRLSVQDSTKEGVDDAVCTARGIDLSVMRSLTIFGSPLLDLQACELLRVLDLEGCKGVNNDTVLKAICKQRFLKYLSLRGTDVDHLHQKIKHLVHLETLDIRDTSVEVVPIEVIRLPLLAHLFGRFELPRRISKEISKQSKLQTLAGVAVTEADKSFENIILHAGKLRKVKICQATSYSSNSSNSPLKERFTGSKALQILSIDSSDLSKEFISFLKAPCAITSIKLRGQLDRLPATPTLRELSDLNRLLLISTGLSIEDLSALQSLPCLEYLKLAEDGHGFRGRSFVVKSGGFPSLRRLCFEAPRLPQVQIEQGSMKSLTILDLLCPDPVIPEPRLGRYYCFLKLETTLGVEGVSYLENLKEVILHHSMQESKVQAWKEEAIRHNKKPSVKRQPQPTIHAA